MDLVVAHEGSYHVAETDELVRVRNLPRRDWQTDPDTAETQARLNQWLQHTPRKCSPRCTCCKRVDGLNPAQAHFLAELFASKGRSVCPFRPGAGKTLASLLAGTVLERALGVPQRAVLIVPASGHEKTLIEARDYAKHWRCSSFRLITYEFLANPKNVDWLEKHAPTLILCDEAHKLKRRTTKAWKRIAKYISAATRAGVGVVFVPFTGTLIGRSIQEFWHYMRVAMQDAAPVPAGWDEADIWSKALDVKVPADARVFPGALSTLAPRPDGDMDRTKRARIQFGQRLVSTPGVVSAGDGLPEVTLKLHATVLGLPPHVQEMVRVLRKDKTLPSGETFVSATDLWRHERALGCGIYKHWDPPPPRAWIEARKAWYQFVRETLEHSRKMDSKVHVANAIDRGDLDDKGALAEWREIRPTFEPHSVTEWIDDTTLNYAAAWLKDPEHERGLCWVEDVAFGHKLSELTGLPYFSIGARDQSGRLVTTYEGGPAILSTYLREQHNLQWFNTNLITACPPTGGQVDQLVARTCRPGQEADEVRVEFLLTTEVSYRCLAQCFQDNDGAQDIDGGQVKLLCYGECMDPVIQGLKNGDTDYAGT